MNGVEVGVEVNIDLMFALFVSRGSFWLYPSSSAGCFLSPRSARLSLSDSVGPPGIVVRSLLKPILSIIELIA